MPRRLTVKLPRTPTASATVLRLLSESSPAGTGDRRPATRGECIDGERPCGFVACSQHLALDVNPETGTIAMAFAGPDGDLVDLHDLRETCALDVADRGGTDLRTVGKLLNVTGEGIRQIETRALRKLEARLAAQGLDMSDLWSHPEPNPFPASYEADGEG